MKRTCFIITFLLLINCSFIDAENRQKKECADEEAFKAESEANRLYDWDSIYESYKKYAHCDDGAIWEGYSDSVGRLLADDWMLFKRLYELCSSDSAFKQFVLKHIDMTVPADTLQRIINNTRLHCPPEYKELCTAIEAASSAGWNPNTK